MIIGIDIRILAQPRRSGIVEYAEQLLSRMVRLAPEHQFKLFYSSFRRPLPSYDWLREPNVSVYSFQIPNNALLLSARLRGRPHFDEMVGGADVFFSPHFLIAPLSKGCRRVTTFHDLSYARFPEFFTLGKRLWHQAMDPARQARWSDHLIAVSESTKTDLVNYYQIDPARIDVIHSGVALRPPTEDRLEEFKTKHQLPERFILSLSTLEPRKNITGIIRAFNRLKEISDFDDVRLIIGGDRGWLDEAIFSEIEHSPAQRYIRHVGYVADQERSSWYCSASVFAYPSFFEGYGLPVLEAMACSTPVVTSHNSSLPEVAGDAAILVDPYNISAIASALGSALGDQALRQRLILKGKARAEERTWDEAAKQTLALLTRP